MNRNSRRYCEPYELYWQRWWPNECHYIVYAQQYKFMCQKIINKMALQLLALAFKSECNDSVCTKQGVGWKNKKIEFSEEKLNVIVCILAHLKKFSLKTTSFSLFKYHEMNEMTLKSNLYLIGWFDLKQTANYSDAPCADRTCKISSHEK